MAAASHCKGSESAKKMPMGQDADAMLRQLTEIKLKYTYEEMLRLLNWRLKTGAFVMNSVIALSGNKRKFAITETSMDGISAAEISRSVDSLMLEQSEQNNRANLGACPDHYVLRPGADNSLEVIETCGSSPVPCQFFIKFGDETGVQTPRDNTWQYQSPGVAYTKSGKLIGGVRHQFKDTNDGFEARLVVAFPMLLPTAILKAHQMHLVCEFSHWFQWIIEHRRRVMV